MSEKKQGPKCKAVTRYWLEFYGHDKFGICTLCGNSGIIDTTKTAVTAAGIHVGRKNYCICPNGQWERKAAMKKAVKDDAPGSQG